MPRKRRKRQPRKRVADSSVSKLQRRAENQNDTGASRYAAGNLDAALESFNSAIRLDSDFASAHTNRGAVHTDKGDYDSAIADHDKAIYLDSTLARAWYNSGVAHQSIDDLTAAIADYDRAIELAPNYARAYHNRGVARRALDDDRADDDFDKAVKHCPDHERILFFDTGLLGIDNDEPAHPLSGHVAGGDQWKSLHVRRKNANVSRRAGAYYNRGIDHYEKGEYGIAI